jgi:NAD(P)-dependent dehydrogenase (short-subunit alcohol dehydrogenase family)
MDVNDKVAVITGAASGIGRAMALRFAQEGARVVVSDLDHAGALAVAEEANERGPGAGLGVACDVTEPEEIRFLIDQANHAFGAIDLFCANAGVGGGGGLEATDDEWDHALAVNVRSHVVAARLLVPPWLERGAGYFLSTASAAGLLTMIGSAPYTVTKHAAVGFAEWLAVTYGDRGIGVSCLCPMGVKTPLMHDGLALPGEAGVGLRIVASSGKVLDPADVAEAVVEGLAEERFLILPHPEVHRMLQGKVADVDTWLARMRSVRASAAAATPSAS